MIPSLIAAGIVAAAVIWWWWTSTHGLLAARTKRSVIVTLKTGETFTGVLFDADRDALILRHAEAIGFGSDHRNAPVEGEMVLLRSNVSYVQAT